jgi:RNAse (barnase) inhibitor barstar
MPHSVSETIYLQGSQFHDLEGFYQVFYQSIEWKEDWAPAHNLDALNDVLYNCLPKQTTNLIWENSQKSAADLGVESTQEFYRRKIEQGSPYNITWAKEQLDKLEAGNGQTLFEIILEIFRSHPSVNLVLK